MTCSTRSLVNLLLRDLVGVLRRDDDRVDAHRLAILVLDRHLALAVRAQVGMAASPVACAARPACASACGPSEIGSGISSGGLVAGEADHHALVARADRVELGVGQLAGGCARDAPVEALTPRSISADFACQSSRLTPQVRSSKPIVGVDVADLANRLAHDGLNIHIGRGGDLAEDRAPARSSSPSRRPRAPSGPRQDRVEHARREIWSQSLSGCPSVTTPTVKKALGSVIKLLLLLISLLSILPHCYIRCRSQAILVSGCAAICLSVPPAPPRRAR